MIILPFLCIIHFCDSLNVLLFVPTLSYSHVSFNGKIADALVSKGHNVVMVLALVDDSIYYNNSRFEVIRKDLGIPSGKLSHSLWHNPGPFEDSSPLNPAILKKLLRVSSLFVEACNEISHDRGFLKLLRGRHFDVGMVEQYDSCGFGLFRILNIQNVVWLSATAVFRPQPEAMGVNYPLSYVPELFAQVSDSMSLMDRVNNVLVASATGLVFAFYSRARQSTIFQKFGVLESEEDLLSTSQSSDSVVVNGISLFDFAMPTSHQISSIGGFTVFRGKTVLKKKWQVVADSSYDGFILVTFGSIAKMTDMTEHMQNMFFTSFSYFPHITFIVKYESANCSIPLPSNVFLTSWIPQIELMAHPNYLALITHGGWSSILESILHGRPLILMPLFADHAKNAKVVESKSVGILINKMTVTENRLVEAIKEISTQSSYRLNCEKLSSMLLRSSAISHTDLLDYRIRLAVKETRKKFPLKPREATLPTFIIRYVDVAILFGFLLTTITT